MDKPCCDHITSLTQYHKSVNDLTRPLIFLGTCSTMVKQIEACREAGIEIHGIIDSDYYIRPDNHLHKPEVAHFEGLPVVAGFDLFDDPRMAWVYRERYNFHNCVNHVPSVSKVDQRNSGKRQMVCDLIKQHRLSTTNIVHPKAAVSKTTRFGCDNFVDAGVVIEPNCVMGNCNNFFAQSFVGYSMKLGDFNVVQTGAMIGYDSEVQDHCYFATNSKALKHKVTYRTGTVVQEGIYLKRGTKENEVISHKSEGRVKSMIM